jgi:hypothetical protein
MINVVDAAPNAPLLHPIGFVQVQALPHITTVPPSIFGAIPWLKNITHIHNLFEHFAQETTHQNTD